MVDAGPELISGEKIRVPPLEVKGRIQDFLKGGSYKGEGVRFADLIHILLFRISLK